MIDKLNKLKSLCKAEIVLSINPHKNYYQSVREFIEESDDRGDFDEETLCKMIETDTVIDLQYYPNSPVGFNCIFHYDIEKALDIALEGSQ